MSDWKTYLDYMFRGDFTTEEILSDEYKRANEIKNDLFRCKTLNLLRDFEFIVNVNALMPTGIYLVHTNYVNNALVQAGFEELFTVDDYLGRREYEKEPFYVRAVSETFRRDIDYRWHLVASADQEAIALVAEYDSWRILKGADLHLAQTFKEGLEWLTEFQPSTPLGQLT